MKRSFGRYYVPDKRDRKFRFSIARTTRKSRVWSCRSWHGDQGAEPSCVGFGWAHWLNCYPIRQFMDPSGIYEIAQHFDEWEGNQYDGTSVRAGAKVLQSLGAISEYQWTVSADTVANHILIKGPVVIGVNWYQGMSNPDSKGVVSITGRSLGGHCVCLVGVLASGMFKLKNSWGTSWGKGGYAYISSPDLQKLLTANGEACVGIERRMSP